MDILQKINNRITAKKTKKYEKTIAKQFYVNWLKRKNDNEISIFLSGLIGDFVYAMAYLSSFAEQNYTKKIVIYFEVQRKELIYTYVLPANCELRQISDKVEAYEMGCFMRTGKYARKGLKTGVISSVPIFSFPNKPTLKTLRDKIYKIQNYNSKPVLPVIPKCEIKSIQDFEKKKSRIVVFNHASSGANGVIGKSISVFEQIAEYLTGIGYEVYTNVIQGQEPIPKTSPLCCSIFELYNICKNISLFVSVRSGITDLMVGSNVNMFVLYCSGTLSTYNKKWKKVYTLAEWHQQGILCEYIPIQFPSLLYSDWNITTFNYFVNWIQKNEILLH